MFSCCIGQFPHTITFIPWSAFKIIKQKAGTISWNQLLMIWIDSSLDLQVLGVGLQWKCVGRGGVLKSGYCSILPLLYPIYPFLSFSLKCTIIKKILSHPINTMIIKMSRGQHLRKHKPVGSRWRWCDFNWRWSTFSGRFWIMHPTKDSRLCLWDPTRKSFN